MPKRLIVLNAVLLALAAGGTVYIVRCESYSVRRGEEADFPPAVHHQRTWVAVVK